MFEEFGKELFGTVTEVVDSLGDNYQNTANAQAAQIERTKVENLLAVKNAELSAKRQEERERLLKNSVYAILGLIAIISLSFAAIKVAKALK